jgi:hypothetical protein
MHESVLKKLGLKSVKKWSDTGAFQFIIHYFTLHQGLECLQDFIRVHTPDITLT